MAESRNTEPNAETADAEIETADAEIEEEVRLGDRDRYDAARSAPEPVRRDLLTLYAFNLELARTPWRVSEPQLGAMRLQWWADLAAAAPSGQTPRGNALVERVAEWIRRRRPPQPLLRTLIEARLRELDPAPMESPAARDAFIENTSGTCLRLAVWIACAQKAGDEFDHGPADKAAADLGYAMGAAALLRAIPAYAARERLMLPPPAGRPIPLAEILRAETPDELRDACADLAAEGLKRLASARARRSAVDPAATPAFLAAWRAEPALRRALKPDLDAHRDFGDESEFRRRATLALAGLFGW